MMYKPFTYQQLFLNYNSFPQNNFIITVLVGIAKHKIVMKEEAILRIALGIHMLVACMQESQEHFYHTYEWAVHKKGPHLV